MSVEKPYNIGEDKFQSSHILEIHEEYMKEENKVAIIGFCECYIFSSQSYYSFPNLSLTLDFDEEQECLMDDMLQKYFIKPQDNVDNFSGIIKIKTISVIVGCNDEDHQQRIVDMVKGYYFSMDTGEKLDMTDSDLHETLSLME